MSCKFTKRFKQIQTHDKRSPLHRKSKTSKIIGIIFDENKTISLVKVTRAKSPFKSADITSF